MSYTLEVGGPYSPERTRYQETNQLRLGRSIHELVRFMASPSPAEIDQHQNGEAWFRAVVEAPDLLALGYRFGTLDWCDVPFQAHRMSHDQGVPRGEPADEILFRTILVDAGTGIIRALRHDTWPGGFSQLVRRAVADQLRAAFNDAAAGRRLDALYQRYSTSEEMVRARADAVCHSPGPVFGPAVEFHYY